VTALPDFVAIAILAAAGLAVGSFLNVVIHRLPVMTGGKGPAGYNLLRPRSACPLCGQALSWTENIPLFSYVWLRGRCSHCDGRMSVRYPLVELLIALAAVGLAWRFGLGWTALAAFAFISVAICIAVIDAEHLLVPDVLVIPLIVAGLLVNAAEVFAPFASAALGAVAGFASLWAVASAFRLLTGREAMGFGDFKLFAAIGAWLGWPMLPLALFIACVAGSIVGIALQLTGRIAAGARFPFAPFLVLGAVVMLVWGAALNRLYWSLAVAG
jgi:leader peptidase (prepilin peptidase) / N-methyltransferase